MGKLHETLAVEANLKGHASRVVKETFTAFTKKAHLFTGKTRRYAPLDDDGEKFPNEDVTMTTTVPDRLEYTWAALIPAIDCTYQKEYTNTVAFADVEIDGEVIAKRVPATALLTLESRLKEIRAIVEKAPTLEPGKGWTPEQARKHVWQATPVESLKRRKVESFKTVSPSTKEHPAQVAKIVEDQTIGTWTQIDVSGEMTSHDKAAMLTRIDTLFRAVKKARARANQEAVCAVEIGKTLIDYVTGVKEEEK